MTLLGFIVAVFLFCYYKNRLRHSRDRDRVREQPCSPHDCGVSWHEEWQRQWADKFRKQAEKRLYHVERHAGKHVRHLERRANRFGFSMKTGIDRETPAATESPDEDEQTLRRARRQAKAEVGFYSHLMRYLGVMAFLALINLMTTRYPWFLWPALGWGIGLFFHYMSVFGRHALRQRYFEPAVEREVRREKMVMNTEKQASIDELSATIAHEIRNPIAAAKSLVQQMGEDPTSVENVEYAKVALDELERVERRVSHLLKYAKEEDYNFENVNVASIIDSALTELRPKLDAGKIRVTRNYITGPTVYADAEKLRQVFSNIVANAVDALEPVTEERRIDFFIENGSKCATVRVRDNGAGIPPEKIDRIFNPFFTTKENGTGLGMAISKKIVEAHEGKIDVVSEPGRHTELVVTLPLPS